MSLRTIETETFDQEKLLQLISTFDDSQLVASIHLPMEPAGAETRKNPIVFKNALGEAEERVRQEGPADGVDDLLARIESLHELAEPTDDFWQHQSEGLTLILAPSEDPVMIRLPNRPRTSVTVTRRPNVIPLLEFAGRHTYQVLTLNLGGVGLYRADRFSTEKLSLGEIPEDLDEAMRYDDPEKSLQFRSSSGPKANSGAETVFHGHGVTGDEEKSRKIQRFLEMIDAGLSGALPDHDAPLLLVGTTDLVGHFREICSYPHLGERSFECNTADRPEAEVRKEIRETIAELDRERFESGLERVAEAVGRGEGEIDLEKVMKSAAEGRVAELWISPDAEFHGSYDASKHAVDLDVGAGKDDNLAVELVRQCLQNGAPVVVCPRADALPEDAGLAAVYRF